MAEMKRICITGGAGFIGSALFNHFSQAGHEVFVIDDLSFGSRKFIDVADSHFFELDILDKPNLQAAFEDIRADWVLHLAAVHFIPWCNAHPEEATKINVQGTENVLDAIARVLPEKFLFASTAAVYPILDSAISEEVEPNPLDVYGRSKLQGEKLCAEFFKQTDATTIACRFFNAFGPNETNPHLIPEIQKQINGGARTINLGNLEPKRDFIHTYDMARAVDALMHKVEGFEVFNLGRGEEYAVTAVVEAFERQLGEPIQIEQEEARIRKVERLHLLADVSKLKAATGWEPRWSLDDGIRTLIEHGKG